MNEPYLGDIIKTWIRCPERALFKYEKKIDPNSDEPVFIRRFRQVKEALWVIFDKGVGTKDEAQEEGEAVLQDIVDEKIEFHSNKQIKQEREILKSILEAYLDENFGHVKNALRLNSKMDSVVVFGDETLLETEIGRYEISANVDYLFLQNDTLTAVDLLPTSGHLTNTLKYWNSSEPGAKRIVNEHFNQEKKRHSPKDTGVLLRSYIVHKGLKELQKSGNLGANYIRHKQIIPQNFPPGYLDWEERRGNVDIQRVDLSDPYSDGGEIRARATLDNSIETQLSDVLSNISKNDAKMESHWESIYPEECNTCPFSISCTRFIRSEVSFHGS